MFNLQFYLREKKTNTKINIKDKPEKNNIKLLEKLNNILSYIINK